MRIALFMAVQLVLISACGGRLAHPVAETRETDDQLTCGHLMAEYRVNRRRIDDIAGEQRGKVDDNIGWLVMMPVFIDLSEAERSEIEALVRRNRKLVALASSRECKPFPPDS